MPSPSSSRKEILSGVSKHFGLLGTIYCCCCCCCCCLYLDLDRLKRVSLAFPRLITLTHQPPRQLGHHVPTTFYTYATTVLIVLGVCSLLICCSASRAVSRYVASVLLFTWYHILGKYYTGIAPGVLQGIHAPDVYRYDVRHTREYYFVVVVCMPLGTRLYYKYNSINTGCSFFSFFFFFFLIITYTFQLNS